MCVGRFSVAVFKRVGHTQAKAMSIAEFGSKVGCWCYLRFLQYSCKIIGAAYAIMSNQKSNRIVFNSFAGPKGEVRTSE